MSRFTLNDLEGLSEVQCYYTGILHITNDFRDYFLKKDTIWSRKAADVLDQYLKETFTPIENDSETSEEK